MKLRFVSPHPHTNQHVVALARGPLIYCLEDADNSWVDDHFKSLAFDPTATVTEDLKTESEIGEPYVALTAHDAGYFLNLEPLPGPHSSLDTGVEEAVKVLNFTPYCLRDNRGGKGHMRVGLRRKH